MNAEIIAIGTELLLGQIANTNAQWLSKQLSALGLNVFYHTVVGDNISRVHNVFAKAEKRSNIIIVTGGLGPTEDDMTREAFQSLSGLSLIEDQQTLRKIKMHFTKQNRQMTPNNRKQAKVFETAKVLPNDFGMAPGMVVTLRGKTWVFLPGVPREMKQLFRDHVYAYLLTKFDDKQIIKSTLLRFIGIGEAQLEHHLQDIIKAQTNPTIAPLAREDGLVLRLTVKAMSHEVADKKLEETKQLILQRVGKYCYGYDNDTIERKVVDMLKKAKYRLSAAESITGGWFINKLISVEGVSEICPGGITSYGEDIKTNVLGVSKQTIANFGIVSEQCAIEMAEQVRKLFQTDIGISFTGVAGPDRLEGEEVGTVYIGISMNEKTRAYKYQFYGDREQIRKRTMNKGFEQIYNLLNS